MNFYERHLVRQKDLELIFKRAMDETPKGGIDDNLMCIMRIAKKETDTETVLFEEAILRRGYKIQFTHKTGVYELFNIISSDYYKYVEDTIIDEFLEKGFVRVADEHQIKRDWAKVKQFDAKIEKANSERNDSLMVHWRTRRRELIEKISKIEENLKP